MSGIIYYLQVWCVFIMISCQTITNTSSDQSSSRALSRRKRFIIFAEGSSFQLVFCTTYPAIITLGDILLWGNTAALAYELPQDPYSPFNHKADPLHRRMDTKTIYFTDYNGKIIHHEPYKRRFIVNPAFAKRSVDGSATFEYEMDRRALHGSYTRDFLKGDSLENVRFHRHGRATLYQQIEGLLQALGADGRMCLLKILCEMGQSHNNPQGPFLQEIMRAVFTHDDGKIPDEGTLIPWKRGRALMWDATCVDTSTHALLGSSRLPKSHTPDDVDEEYDAAHSAQGSCEELYPCARKPA